MERDVEEREIDGVVYKVRVIPEEPSERMEVKRGGAGKGERSSVGRRAHYTDLDMQFSRTKSKEDSESPVQDPLAKPEQDSSVDNFREL